MRVLTTAFKAGVKTLLAVIPSSFTGILFLNHDMEGSGIPLAEHCSEVSPPTKCTVLTGSVTISTGTVHESKNNYNKAVVGELTLNK